MKGLKKKMHRCNRKELALVAGSEDLYVTLWRCSNCGGYFDRRGASVDQPTHSEAEWQLIAKKV